MIVLPPGVQILSRSAGEPVRAGNIRSFLQAIDTLSGLPIFNTADLIAESKIPKHSAHRILRGLADSGILIVTREGKGKNPAIFRFSRLIAITETGNR
jgi:hypothetical protein